MLTAFTICSVLSQIANDYDKEQIRIVLMTVQVKYQLLLTRCVLLYLTVDTYATTLTMYDYHTIRMYDINRLTYFY